MVQIKTTGKHPEGDGEVNRYTSAEGLQQDWFRKEIDVVFVNGMDNTPKNHFDSAMALSLMQGCSVIGIYNKTDGFWSDLGQCLTDKLKLVTAQAGGFNGWVEKVDKGYEEARGKNNGLSRIDFVADLIASNKATLALYEYLTEDQSRLNSRIHAHSQGNLITSNALTAVALALGPQALRNLRVYSFGSPCRFWPAGIYREDNAFTFDMVSMLDYKPGFTTSKVGLTQGLFAHGFHTYHKHDAEFTVNRFRWGSFRMTASMDEKGLASYMVGMGNNPIRLKGIWNWLIKHHWSDSDDVVFEYVKIVKRINPSLFRQIARSDKEVIKLMIRALDEGWTTKGEHEQIAYLKGFIA
jgi:hypothetical protein